VIFGARVETLPGSGSNHSLDLAVRLRGEITVRLDPLRVVFGLAPDVLQVRPLRFYLRWVLSTESFEEELLNFALQMSINILLLEPVLGQLCALLAEALLVHVDREKVFVGHCLGGLRLEVSLVFFLDHWDNLVVGGRVVLLGPQSLL